MAVASRIWCFCHIRMHTSNIVVVVHKVRYNLYFTPYILHTIITHIHSIALCVPFCVYYIIIEMKHLLTSFDVSKEATAHLFYSQHTH